MIYIHVNSFDALNLIPFIENLNIEQWIKSLYLLTIV